MLLFIAMYIFSVQGSASECTLVTMLAARTTALRRYKEKYPDIEDGVLLTKLVAYCSNLVRKDLKKVLINYNYTCVITV